MGNGAVNEGIPSSSATVAMCEGMRMAANQLVYTSGINRKSQQLAYVV